jgi:NADH dehydrogenase
MRVLVLGGAGFLGRHVVSALAARGHHIVIGSRDSRRVARVAASLNVRVGIRPVRFEQLTVSGCWDAALDGVDVAVNCVGILREWGAATYERIHHLAPAALAADCARRRVRLIHISALGLHDAARSRFIGSKLRGERAIEMSGAPFAIVRPSLLDGDGGYGARWLRAVARLPLHFVPIDAVGRIAVLDANDAGRAIARLCEIGGGAAYREVELGGPARFTLDEHLGQLRARRGRPAARVVRIPPTLARLASHAAISCICRRSRSATRAFAPRQRAGGQLAAAAAGGAGANRRRRAAPTTVPLKDDRGTASARGRASLGRMQPAMVKIDRPRERRERTRAERGIEHAIGNAAVEDDAQRALDHEARVLARERASRVLSAFLLVIGNGMRGEKADSSAVWMPPADSGDTRPAASRSARRRARER